MNRLRRLVGPSKEKSKKSGGRKRTSLTPKTGRRNTDTLTPLFSVIDRGNNWSDATEADGAGRENHSRPRRRPNSGVDSDEETLASTFPGEDLDGQTTKDQKGNREFPSSSTTRAVRPKHEKPYHTMDQGSDAEDDANAAESSGDAEATSARRGKKGFVTPNAQRHPRLFSDVSPNTPHKSASAPVHRRQNTASTDRMDRVRRSYRQQKCSKEEFLQVVQGEMRHSIITMLEEYRNDGVETETAAHAQEVLYPLVVKLVKKWLQVKDKLDLRTEHELQRIILSYSDHSAHDNMDDALHVHVVPPLLDCIANLYFDAGMDLQEWEEDHGWVGAYDENRAGGGVQRGNLSPENGEEGSLDATGVHLKENSADLSMKMIDSIPPGKLEVEIQEGEFRGISKLFRYPEIYVVAKCLWDLSLGELKTAPVNSSKTVLEWKATDGNVKSFHFPGGAAAENQPEVELGVYAIRGSGTSHKKGDKCLGHGIANVISVVASPRPSQITIRTVVEMKKRGQKGAVRVGFRFIPSRLRSTSRSSPPPSLATAAEHEIDSSFHEEALAPIIELSEKETNRDNKLLRGKGREGQEEDDDVDDDLRQNDGAKETEVQGILPFNGVHPGVGNNVVTAAERDKVVTSMKGESLVPESTAFLTEVVKPLEKLEARLDQIDSSLMNEELERLKQSFSRTANEAYALPHLLVKDIEECLDLERYLSSAKVGVQRNFRELPQVDDAFNEGARLQENNFQLKLEEVEHVVDSAITKDQTHLECVLQKLYDDHKPKPLWKRLNFLGMAFVAISVAVLVTVVYIYKNESALHDTMAEWNFVPWLPTDLL